MRYKVFLNGHNFMMEIDGVIQRVGFYTTRLVDAEDEADAERGAVDLMREHPSLAVRRNGPDNPASMTVENVEVVGADHEAIKPGLVFYPEECDD